MGTPEEEERTVKHAKEAPLLQVRRCQSQDCEEEEERRTRKRAVGEQDAEPRRKQSAIQGRDGRVGMPGTQRHAASLGCEIENLFMTDTSKGK